MKSLIVVAHNLRSAHNVGSLLRTAEGLGVDEVILTGYTPFPSLQADDPRLPHERLKVDKLIQKTALDAQLTQSWRRETDVFKVLDELRTSGYTITALEQTPDSIPFPSYISADKQVIMHGREVEGMEAEVLAVCDQSIEIPMFGSKESFNVVQAAAMALYHCRFIA